MKNPTQLLPLAPILLLLAVSSPPPLAAAGVTLSLRFPGGGQSPVSVKCVGDGVYAANSTYQANLRRLAALLPAEASATPAGHYYYAERAVGYWPNRLLARSYCWRRRGDDAGSGYSCADCIAGAFLEVERACPYRREASFSSRNCTLDIAETRIFRTGAPGSVFQSNIMEFSLESGLAFQAIGFACLFFMQLQEWRSRKRGTLMHPAAAPPLSGDQNVGN